MIFNFFVFVFLASAISSHASSEMHEYVESLHALEPSKKARKLLYPTPYRNSNYLTLAPEFKPVGPSFNYTDDTINISELHKQSVDFYTKVFRSIVVDAHNLAKDFYQEGDNNNWTYYTFMVLALVTPHHESRMTHFRTVSGDKCSPDINDLHAYFNPISYKKVSSSIFQNKALSDTAKVLRSNFKNPYNTLVPNCDQIDKSKIVQQVLTSTNLMDFGLYQINIKSHYADFLQPERALNLYSLIKNGIHYLWNQKSDDGFYELRNSIEYDLAKITNENAPADSL